MANRIPDKAFLDSIRSERELLVEQIRQSERTIERSRGLLKQLDELLAGRQDEKA